MRRRPGERFASAFLRAARSARALPGAGERRGVPSLGRARLARASDGSAAGSAMGSSAGSSSGSISVARTGISSVGAGLSGAASASAGASCFPAAAA